jgi:hypothetical protein
LVGLGCAHEEVDQGISTLPQMEKDDYS